MRAWAAEASLTRTELSLNSGIWPERRAGRGASPSSAIDAVILQLGATTKEKSEMMISMVCHVLEGELQIVQDGKEITGKKNYAWTCNKGTIEHVVNKGRAVAIMRITDLMA